MVTTFSSDWLPGWLKALAWLATRFLPQVGPAFRERVRRFPPLVHDVVIDWYKGPLHKRPQLHAHKKRRRDIQALGILGGMQSFARPLQGIGVLRQVQPLTAW